jgi:hypothetical protein
MNKDKVYTGKAFNHIQNLTIRKVGIDAYIAAVRKKTIPHAIPLIAIFIDFNN